MTGGLWPAELSTITAETATLAEYLKADLQRIADSANDELKVVKRAGMSDPARQAEEARVIDEARARAARRVESTMRQLHAVQARAAAGYPRAQVAEPFRSDLDKTQVIPAVVLDAAAGGAPEVAARDEPQVARPSDRDRDNAAGSASASSIEETQVIPAVTEAEPVLDGASGGAPVPSGRDEPETAGYPDRGGENAGGAASTSPIEDTQVIPAVVLDAASQDAQVAASKDEPDAAGPSDRDRDNSAGAAPPSSIEETQVVPAVTEAEPVLDAASGDAPVMPSGDVATARRRTEDIAGTKSDIDRLNRLLEFVVRQEPRLNWAVGNRVDGATVLVTDLAHGWIPSGITLPAGVRLLEPGRRAGRVSALIGDTVRVVAYAPGDSLRRSAGFAATKSSLEPRKLPAIDNLGAVLSAVTRRHDGLPRIVRRLAEAAAAGTGIVDQEVDVLRVHLDTVRYQLLVQYPSVDPAILLKCLLLAATEAMASGDSVSANYHLAWYQKLAAPPSSG